MSDTETLEEARTATGAPDAPGAEALADPRDDAPEQERAPVDNRIAVAVAFPIIGCAVMVGGIFAGVSPRIYAAVSGLLGIGLALLVARLGRRSILANLLTIVGLFVIGLIVLLPDVGAIVGVTGEIDEATRSASVVRPPVAFLDGWKAIQAWIMAMLGFGATWVALVVGWRSAGLLIPLPITAIAAISVPENAQVGSGLASLVLFAVGLGVMASEQAAGDDPETRPSIGYELRKAAKGLPIIAGITVALFFLAQTDFLFPDPAYDPAEQPQRPKTQPLDPEVKDRVLFEVKSDLDGPFRMGSLDVYFASDGTWRLPPFAASVIEEIDETGIVDEELDQQLTATFTVRGLEGAVLPSLPNTAGVAATGPKLGFDTRNNNIRLVSGQAETGFTYTVTAAGLPTVEDLESVDFRTVPDGGGGEPDIAQFTEMPEPPAAVTSLIAQAPTTSTWAKFDFLRTWVLDTVTATGTGRPVPVTMERVEDMIAGSQEGSPFEIVALQAMLARWVGVPSRIGYGFDGGERVEGVLQVRPANGATFLEVYVPGHKWLPVIGTPRKAEPTVGADPNLQRLDPTIIPSNEVEVQIHLPVVVEPRSVLGKQIAVIVLLVVLFALLVFLLWVTYPGVRKAQLRARRRTQARQEGVSARVALAYSEWRDYAADLGYHFPAETPLMFLERFADDDEHAELAWLTTRVLWGDLRDTTDPEVASIAEELSRSLRRRLASVQAGSLRLVATLSRISLREPFLGQAIVLPGRSAKSEKTPPPADAGNGRPPEEPREQPRAAEELALSAPQGGMR